MLKKTTNTCIGLTILVLKNSQNCVKNFGDKNINVKKRFKKLC